MFYAQKYVLKEKSEDINRSSRKNSGHRHHDNTDFTVFKKYRQINDKK